MIKSVTNNPDNSNIQYAHNAAKNVAGTAGGIIGARILCRASRIPAMPVIHNLVKLERSVSVEHSRTILDALEQMKNNSVLKDTNFETKIFDKATLEDADMSKKYQTAIRVDKKLSKFIKSDAIRAYIAGTYSKRPLYAIIKGAGAAYAEEKNMAYFADNYLIAGPHEYGHAIIHNTKGTFGKFLSNAYAFIGRYRIHNKVLILGLLARNHSDKDEKDLNTFEKAEKRFHKYLPFITGALSIPCLFNEAQASITAAKYMKPLLPQKVFKQMNKGNIMGFATYVMAAALNMGCVAAGVKIKDATCNALKKYFSSKEENKPS